MTAPEYTFGIPDTYDQNWLVQNNTENKTSQEALLLNNNGEPVKAHYYQKVNERTIQFTPADGETLPEIGSTKTIGGETYYVTGVTKNQSNSAFQTYSITLKRFIATNLPSGSSSFSSSI